MSGEGGGDIYPQKKKESRVRFSKSFEFLQILTRF